MDKLIGGKTPASGELARLMLAIPKTLAGDAARKLAGMVGATGGGGGAGGHGISSPGPVTGTVASWFARGVKLAGVPVSWIPGLEEIAHYESSDNPNAINQTPAGVAAGTPMGIMQEIMSTFLAYHVPGSSMNIYDPIANIASASRYIRANYGTPWNTPGLVSVAHGGAYTGYDTGGWLPPGMTTMVNQTGRPEAVLTPDESGWLKQTAAAAVASRNAPQNNIQFIYQGTQQPTPEQRAIMMRDLAMTLSG
jgi:SLT domain-containing protein